MTRNMLFETAMKAAGNRCDTITPSGSGHVMGGWAKLNNN